MSSGQATVLFLTIEVKREPLQKLVQPPAPQGGARGLNRWFVLGGVLLSHTLAGAVPSALSGLASGFGMEYRAFPCRYDHRDDCTGSAPSSSGAVIRLSVMAAPHHARARRMLVCVVGGWVGCGPYSGRSRSCCITHPLGHFTVQGRLVWGVLLFVSAY